GGLAIGTGDRRADEPGAGRRARGATAVGVERLAEGDDAAPARMLAVGRATGGDRGVRELGAELGIRAVADAGGRALEVAAREREPHPQSAELRRQRRID